MNLKHEHDGETTLLHWTPFNDPIELGIMVRCRIDFINRHLRFSACVDVKNIIDSVQPVWCVNLSFSSRRVLRILVILWIKCSPLKEKTYHYLLKLMRDYIEWKIGRCKSRLIHRCIRFFANIFALWQPLCLLIFIDDCSLQNESSFRWSSKTIHFVRKILCCSFSLLKNMNCICLNKMFSLLLVWKCW